MYNEPVAINLPLQAANETETKIDEDPPPYQNPQLDFSGGWKNHRFAIFFWIHTIAVILVSIKLGIPAIAPYIKHNAFGKSEQMSSNRDIKPLLCGLGGAATVGGLVSFLSFIALQLCAVTFGNIIHFITACSIGHWWFPIEVSQQYTIGTSIKRAFTTNFGTICFGSFFEAIIKALSSSTKEHRRKSILSCIFGCILQMIDDCIGYLNEWAFIYAALTGQGFVQASRSFLTLFQARGWTAIINDSLVGTTLFMINFVIGVISAVAGGFIAYFMMVESTEQIRFTIIIVLISFFIGLCMSTIITTILKSCVRTIFVCFALNPAALGATHPDHLQSLTKVWHEVYPQEFSDSGYINPYKETMV
ncbi:unnamed protein product [Rotaria sp. Silwood1]|nr:unnamed protein product [Rotaria sp. Silwood1]CAF3448640.1 unnamed protein product [Rotaria sp. Silwood1]CAF3477276.1 unnamed protein product [Rotaria sp. Silwood1]CAF4782686.1 unnamed protein product [Rotaria sp. Silwood1]